MRNFGALVLGLLVGMVLNMVVIGISMTLHPLPTGVDMNDTVAMGEYISNLPPLAYLLALIAHNLQAFVGGWVAARLCKDRPMAWAGAIGALTMLGSAYNMSLYGGPSWMMLDIPLNLGLGLAAGWLETQRRARLPAASPAVTAPVVEPTQPDPHTVAANDPHIDEV